MQRNVLVWSPILVLLFISLSLVMPVAAATGYVGNDNAEFGSNQDVWQDAHIVE